MASTTAPMSSVPSVTPKATAETAGASTWLQQFAAPTAGVLVPAGIAALQALPGKYIKSQQERNRLQAQALRKHGAQLTSADISEAQLAGEAHERKARAMASRGSASGGRSGLDVERARDVRRQGAQKTAMRLSEAGRRRLGEYAANLGTWQKQAEFLGKEAVGRRARFYETLGGIAASKPSEKLFGELGKLKRKKKVEKFKTGTQGIEPEMGTEEVG